MHRDNIQKTRYKFDIQDSDIAHIQKAGAIIVPQLTKIIDVFYQWLKKT